MSSFQNRKRFASLGIVVSLATLGLLVAITACTDQAKAKPNLVHKDAPRPGVVAKIGGEEITEEALIGTDKAEFFEVEKRKYDLKMDRLNKLMVEKIIGAEAKKAGMSLDDYINKKIVGGDVKISDKEFKKFVADKHIPESQINPQIKERIMSYLQTLKKQDLITQHVAKLTKSQPVEVYFDKPKLEFKVDVGQSPTYGKEDAPITIVEFSDFQCPFCSRAAETVTQIKKKYGNKVRLAFKHFPLPMHQEARPAAEAAMCVNEQGSDKFWKFHDLAFKNQDKLDKASLEKYAKDAGADVNKVTECLNSKKYAAAVQKDLEYGESMGVKSTPTSYICSKKTDKCEMVSGAVPVDSFSEIIDEMLSSKG